MQILFQKFKKITFFKLLIRPNLYKWLKLFFINYFLPLIVLNILSNFFYKTNIYITIALVLFSTVVFVNLYKKTKSLTIELIHSYNSDYKNIEFDELSLFKCIEHFEMKEFHKVYISHFKYNVNHIENLIVFTEKKFTDFKKIFQIPKIVFLGGLGFTLTKGANIFTDRAVDGIQSMTELKEFYFFSTLLLLMVSVVLFTLKALIVNMNIFNIDIFKYNIFISSLLYVKEVESSKPCN